MIKLSTEVQSDGRTRRPSATGSAWAPVLQRGKMIQQDLARCDTEVNHRNKQSILDRSDAPVWHERSKFKVPALIVTIQRGLPAAKNLVITAAA